MAKFLAVVGFQNGVGPGPLPPMDASEAGELHLTYLVNGERRGGYSVVGQVPQAPSCVVLLDTLPATMAAMEASGAAIMLEEVVEDATTS